MKITISEINKRLNRNYHKWAGVVKDNDLPDDILIELITDINSLGYICNVANAHYVFPEHIYKQIVLPDDAPDFIVFELSHNYNNYSKDAYLTFIKNNIKVIGRCAKEYWWRDDFRIMPNGKEKTILETVINFITEEKA